MEYLDPPRPVQNPVIKDRIIIVPRRFLATLEVSGVWKGKVGHTIVLHTREDSTDCVGFWKDIGTELVVFATRRDRRIGETVIEEGLNTVQPKAVRGWVTLQSGAERLAAGEWGATSGWWRRLA